MSSEGEGRYEIAENEVEGVGNMNSQDSSETASYLAKAVKGLRERMIHLWDKGTNQGYVRAYQSMAPIGQGQTCDASTHEPNRLKNRYGNIMAYDAHRVKLEPIDGDPDSDYINASWVDGYKKPNGYIASQGPVPLSFNDFWRMMWQYDIETIVMVTHEVEKGRVKCHRYWPDPTSEPPVTKLLFGEIMVQYVSAEVHNHYIRRVFSVEHNGETRTVRQFAYTSWPDHGVPLTTHEMLSFRNAVNESVTKPDSPILIHCSAGVGRTGTYIAIDACVKQVLDMGGMVDVDAVVSGMRERRNYMVQTEIQYMFIYRAVLDALADLLATEMKKLKQARATLPRQRKVSDSKDDNQEAEQEESEEDMRVIEEAAEEARTAKEAEDAKENEELRQILEQQPDESRQRFATLVGSESDKTETLGRGAASVAHAKSIIGFSIKDRLKMLQEAEQRNSAEYNRSYMEWQEKNKMEAEQYDLTSSLTPVQSRVEALKQKGLLL